MLCKVKSLIHTNKYLRDPIEREKQIKLAVHSSTMIGIDNSIKKKHRRVRGFKSRMEAKIAEDKILEIIARTIKEG